jgi:hypothetical protein
MLVCNVVQSRSGCTGASREDWHGSRAGGDDGRVAPVTALVSWSAMAATRQGRALDQDLCWGGRRKGRNTELEPKCR